MTKVFKIEQVDVNGTAYFNLTGPLLAEHIGSILDDAWKALGAVGERPKDTGLLFSKRGTTPMISFRAKDVKKPAPQGKGPATSGAPSEEVIGWADAILAGLGTLGDLDGYPTFKAEVVAELERRKPKAPPIPTGKAPAAPPPAPKAKAKAKASPEVAAA